jgi:hypothetical protein
VTNSSKIYSPVPGTTISSHRGRFTRGTCRSNPFPWFFSGLTFWKGARFTGPQHIGKNGPTFSKTMLWPKAKNNQALKRTTCGEEDDMISTIMVTNATVTDRNYRRHKETTDTIWITGLPDYPSPSASVCHHSHQHSLPPHIFTHFTYISSMTDIGSCTVIVDISL